LFYFAHSLVAQNDASSNLPNFYQRKFHLGFLLGYNQASFRINSVPVSQFADTIKAINSSSQPGFTIAPVFDLKLQERLRLRLLAPMIIFGSRTLEYTVGNKVKTEVVRKVVESTWLSIPINLKLQSKRIHNFGAYVLGGAGYSWDLIGSKKGSGGIGGGNTSLNEQIKLFREDYYYEVGTGIDFYFPYFKYSIEVKVQEGFNNVLNKSKINEFNAPINKLRSHLFFINMTFEG
jgi:hypothetical protein